MNLQGHRNDAGESRVKIWLFVALPSVCLECGFHLKPLFGFQGLFQDFTNAVTIYMMKLLPLANTFYFYLIYVYMTFQYIWLEQYITVSPVAVLTDLIKQPQLKIVILIVITIRLSVLTW